MCSHMISNVAHLVAIFAAGQASVVRFSIYLPLLSNKASIYHCFWIGRRRNVFEELSLDFDIVADLTFLILRAALVAQAILRLSQGYSLNVMGAFIF